MKINVCSGRQVLEGWINVDVVVSTHPKAKGPPQILAEMHAIPLDDNVADELMCIHGIEHVEPWVAEKALDEWFRLLKPGGLLIIECPDLVKCCQNYLSGLTVPGKHPDQFGLWGIYGDATSLDPFMLHRYGYSPASLAKLLKAHGFKSIQEETPQWHAGGRVRRDMRMTARKPA